MASAHHSSLLTFHAQYDDPYVQPLILSALSSRLPTSKFNYKLVTEKPSDTPANNAPPEESLPDTRTLQIFPYESLSFTKALKSPPDTFLVNSYIYRKALIRKHFLAHVVRTWTAKNPTSILKTNIPESCEIEIDYAEFLDEAVVDAWELKWSLGWRGVDDDGTEVGEFERKQPQEEKSPDLREWWILKPGMSDGANGIRLFSTETELRDIFRAWDPPESDDEGGHAGEEGKSEEAGQAMNDKEHIITSQLRHFVTQRYVDAPLLLPEGSRLANRKFHVRTYVLSVGALSVYVYRPMLALFSSKTYTPPWKTERDVSGNLDLSSHLTNTCFQTSGERSTAKVDVKKFWSLPDLHLPGIEDWKTNVFQQICNITAEAFTAAASVDTINFQPLPCAFELFGVDYLIDEEGKTWLLEVNAFPDFKQSGDELKDLVEGLWEDVIDVAVRPYFFPGSSGEAGIERGDERMVKVLNMDLGRS